MSEQQRHLVRLLMEDDISRGDTAVAERIIAPDFVDHTNPPGLQHGLAGHNGVVALFRAAFPDGWWQIEDTLVDGDKVAIRTTFTGTHLGDFFGIPPTGKAVTFTGTHVMRIADGRIAEHWGNNDDLGLMRQLDALLARAEPAVAGR